MLGNDGEGEYKNTSSFLEDRISESVEEMQDSKLFTCVVIVGIFQWWNESSWLLR